MNKIIIARVIEGDEEAKVIADIRARIPTLPKVGDLARWERGWSENWEAYSKSGNPDDLRPKYIRQKQPIRYNGRFVWPQDDDAEMKWYQGFFPSVIRAWLKDCSAIYEFGSGSGHNLACIKRMFPKIRTVGLDWSWAAVTIAQSIDHGTHFDFYNPVISDFPPRFGVLTVGALEQTGGTKWLPFMEELVAARPAICVHLEPIVEWYDPRNPVDQTSIEVHDAKGFWTGFPEWCVSMRRQGKIQLLEANRTGIGSIHVEGYSLIVWRPI